MTVSPTNSSLLVSKKKVGLSHGPLHHTLNNKRDNGMKNASWQSIEKECARRRHSAKMKSFLLDGFPSSKSLHSAKRQMAGTASTSSSSARAAATRTNRNKLTTSSMPPISAAHNTSSSTSIFAHEIDSILHLIQKDEYVRSASQYPSLKRSSQQNDDHLSRTIPNDIFIPTEHMVTATALDKVVVNHQTRLPSTLRCSPQ